MADAAVHHHAEPASAPAGEQTLKRPSTDGTRTDVDETPDSPGGVKRITPRPTYLSNSAPSRDTMLPQQMLNRHESIELDDYFVGPRDLDRHSKWPTFMRLHGSVLPRMIVPILFMACWSTLITCLSVFVHDLGLSSVLLTVLGFVVGLALSLRSSTAYERYAEGRKYWAQLMHSSRTLARLIWLHTEEREGDDGKEDLLAKLSGINLIIAFAIALKHKLRFEPDVAYEDLAGLIAHLDTYAKAASEPNLANPPKPGTLKAVGSYLSLPFAMSNPRKAIKRAKKPLGNLPFEILSHLSAYVNSIIRDDGLKLPSFQGQAAAALASMDEVMTGTERVLNTPLPLAYKILISQITWIYVLVLPFQLYPELKWITIPASLIATYIIHGIAAISTEIENPFGIDVNDLPLDIFCQQIAADLDIITSTPPTKPESFVNRHDNMVLFPLSRSGVRSWKERSVEDIRSALRAKATISPGAMMEGINVEPKNSNKTEVA